MIVAITATIIIAAIGAAGTIANLPKDGFGRVPTRMQ